MPWQFVNQLCSPHGLRVNNRRTLSIPGNPLRCRGCHLLFEIKKHFKPAMIWRGYTGNTVLHLQDKFRKTWDLKKKKKERNNKLRLQLCLHPHSNEMHIDHTVHTFKFSLKCCVVLLANAFLSLWMQSRFFFFFFEQSLESQGCTRAGEIHLPPPNHILTCLTVKSPPKALDEGTSSI